MGCAEFEVWGGGKEMERRGCELDLLLRTTGVCSWSKERAGLGKRCISFLLRLFLSWEVKLYRERRRERRGIRRRRERKREGERNEREILSYSGSLFNGHNSWDGPGQG